MSAPIVDASRRVGAVPDPAFGDEELDEVATAGGEDGVDADPGQIGTVQRRPRDAPLRVRGGDDVPPGEGGDDGLQQVEKDRGREKLPMDARQVPAERLDGVDEGVHALRPVWRGCPSPDGSGARNG